MLKNKRAVSGIIVLVIMIALVLVAAGILWKVIGNLLEGRAETLAGTDKCLGLEIKPKSLECTSENCTVRLERSSMSTTQSVRKVILTFSNETESGEEIVVTENIPFFKIVTSDETEMGISPGSVTLITTRIVVEGDGEDFDCNGFETKSVEN